MDLWPCCTAQGKPWHGLHHFLQARILQEVDQIAFRVMLINGSEESRAVVDKHNRRPLFLGQQAHGRALGARIHDDRMGQAVAQQVLDPLLPELARQIGEHHDLGMVGKACQGLNSPGDLFLMARAGGKETLHEIMHQLSRGSFTRAMVPDIAMQREALEIEPVIALLEICLETGDEMDDDLIDITNNQRAVAVEGEGLDLGAGKGLRHS